MNFEYDQKDFKSDRKMDRPSISFKCRLLMKFVWFHIITSVAMGDMTMDYDFFSSMMTSVFEDFDLLSANVMFEASVESTSASFTVTNTTLQPYVVCSKSQTNARTRAFEISEIFNVSMDDLSTLYNDASFSCFVTGLPHGGPDDSLEITDNNPFTPLTALSKLRAGLTSYDFDDLVPKQIFVGLCDFISYYNDGDGNSLLIDFGLTNDTEVNLRLQSLPYYELLTVVEGFANAMDEDCSYVYADMSALPEEDGTGFTVALPQNTSLSCAIKIALSLTVYDDVCNIERMQPFLTSNVEVQWVLQSGFTDVRPWFDKGLNGSNVVVTVSDSGLDINNCYFWDSQRVMSYRTYQPENRKIVYYYDYQDRFDYYNGHGTHVSGTVAGQRAVDGITESTGLADGVAPGAKLAFFDIGFGETCCYVPGTSLLLGTAYNSAGSQIHSASWGSQDASYSSTSSSFDNYIYSRDSLLVVLAAGNYGSATTTQTVISPTTAKNVVSVGATDGEGRGLTSSSLGSDYLAYFSSRGPTTDGRIKPDVVAPGFYTLSAGSRPSIGGECDPLSENDIPDAPGSFGDEFGLYYNAGTSMATPAVSGISAMIRQYFLEGWFPTGSKVEGNEINNPSAALLKAVLVNGAVNLKGIDNGGTVLPIAAYDNNQGFGRVNLLTSLPLEDKNDISAEIFDRETIENGEIKEYTFTVSESCCAEYISVTLVWTDPRNSAGCVKCVVNDLDLLVTKNDEFVSYPNGLTTPDSINNVERIRVSANVGDTFSVKVSGTNLATQSQLYSLVATGCFGGRDNAAQLDVGCPGTAETGSSTCLGVEAYLCDSDGERTSFEGEESITICFTPSPDHTIDYLNNLVFDIGGVSLMAIEDSVLTDLTEMIGKTVVSVSHPLFTSSNSFLMYGDVMQQTRGNSPCLSSYQSIITRGNDDPSGVASSDKTSRIIQILLLLSSYLAYSTL